MNTDQSLSSLADRVRDARSRMEFTQAQSDERMAVTPLTVHRWETGQSRARDAARRAELPDRRRRVNVSFDLQAEVNRGAEVQDVSSPEKAEDEAVFMLGACASFSSYLARKHQRQVT